MTTAFLRQRPTLFRGFGALNDSDLIGEAQNVLNAVQNSGRFESLYNSDQNFAGHFSNLNNTLGMIAQAGGVITPGQRDEIQQRITALRAYLPVVQGDADPVAPIVYVTPGQTATTTTGSASAPGKSSILLWVALGVGAYFLLKD